MPARLLRRWSTEPISELAEGLTLAGDRPASDDPAPTIGRLLRRTAPSPAVLVVLLLVAMGSHGYEIFNQHLTIDEELVGSDYWRGWVAQGRWVMGLFTYVLVPHPVGPVFSTMIGVLGFAGALVVAVRPLVKSPGPLVVAVAIGIACPTLPFLFSYSTIGYGVGVGALAAVLATHQGLVRGGPVGVSTATALLTVAIGIYDPFLFVLAMVGLLWLTGAAATGGLSWLTVAQTAVRITMLSCAAFVASRLVTMAAQAATGIGQSPYTSSILDLHGLLVAPGDRLVGALRDVGLLYVGSSSVFDEDLWPLKTVVVGTMAIIGIHGLVTHRRPRPGLPLVLVAATLAFPVLPELTTEGLVPLRSQVYVPFLMAGLTAVAIEVARPWRLRAPAVLMAGGGVAALVLMSYANRLYLTTDITYQRDSQVAFQLHREIARLPAADEAGHDGPDNLVIIGSLTSGDGLPTPRAETMGGSFLAWDAGNPVRIAGLLRYSAGTDIEPADVATHLGAAEHADAMPVWPHEGSVVREGRSIVVKLSEPTASQLAAWCAQPGQSSAWCAEHS